MIQHLRHELPHGIALQCRVSGEPGQPVLMFLHGFPEGAFIWDDFLEHFARPEHGGYRCVAPNLRGYERSSAPSEIEAYRPKHLVQDLVALAQRESPNRPLAALVAHDWGGALAWNLANQHPDLLQGLFIVNAPHPGAFLRELQHNPAQREASAYMNFLIRPDAAALLREDGFRRLWEILIGMSAATTTIPSWLDDATRARYQELWSMGLDGGLNLYRASPLRPPSGSGSTQPALSLPREMLTIEVPTLVLWGMLDKALLPGLIEGLEGYVPQLSLHRIAQATHWLIHEQPELVKQHLASFLAVNRDTPLPPQAGGS
jgi:pimeloyl-ACP methyl ester carboxylesterase